MDNHFDVIVIGSGSGGLTVSIGLAGAGKKVALVERGLIGGDCTNFGCVPSKALIDIGKKIKNGNYSPDKGLGVCEVLKLVRDRRKKIQDEETVEKIEKYGMKIFKGFASFKDKNTVLVDHPQPQPHPLPGREGSNQKSLKNSLELTAKNIVISTGSHPFIVPIEGLDKKDLLTNENIFEQTDDIKDLVVVGGGYIGCEMAEAFANLGVNVTIVQRNERLIPRESEEASRIIKEVFENKNINVLTSSIVEKAEGGKLFLRNKDGVSEAQVKYDKVLVSLGRKPNVGKLNLENAGIIFDGKGIVVDKYNRTNKKNIFAIGDCVKGNPQFTHLANNEGRGVIRNILVPFIKNSTRKAFLPAVLYTNIEIARVGKTRAELLKSKNEEDIVTHIMYFSENDRSKLTEDMIGFVEINFRRVSGKILGATIVAKGAGEMLPILTSAMDNKISAYNLSKTIFAYPTKAELIKKVCDKFVVGTLSNFRAEAKYIIKDNILQIITGIIWIILIFMFYSYKSMNNLSIEQIALDIYNFVGGTAIGPFIYIFLYAIRPVVLFPATLMTFMSGALFGFWGGLLFTLIGENMSASFAYFLGRVFGKKLIDGDSEGGILNTMKSKANENSFVTILMTRLLFFPFDLVNYISGFLKINYKGFIFATFVGIIPGASVFILAGSAFQSEELKSFSDAIKNIDITMLYYAAGLFILTILLAKFLRRKGY